jgi:predicted nucleic acid-binding Zn ribbon protein
MLFVLSLMAHALARLLARSGDDGSKDIEILVLRHQLKVLRRQVGRPKLRATDRTLLVSVARALPRARWASFMVTPHTLLRWHREPGAKPRGLHGEEVHGEDALGLGSEELGP